MEAEVVINKQTMRFNHLKLIIWSVFIIGCCPLIAQDEAFKGGIGDGFTLDTTNLEFLDFTVGGIGDGFSTDSTNQEFLDFSVGGFGDGFTTSSFTNNFADFCYGGIGDGFATEEMSIDFLDFTSGGNSDGFSFASSSTNDFNDMYKGGDSDGFAYDKYGHIIYWTGNLGTNWNVTGNWENGIIPSYCNPVVIPAGVPNFPAVNAGLLRIGYYKNEGDYKCQSLKINTGAEMLTRVNCFVENYELIFIQGKLYVKNPAANAFTNLWEGLIRLKPSAELIVKE